MNTTSTPTSSQLAELAQAPVMLTPTGGVTASGQPTATVQYSEAAYPANNSAPHPLDSTLLINPGALQPAPDPVPPVAQPHQAVPASVAQAWPAPYPPQTWAQPRTMVKWVGLGLLLGVLAALPKAPPPRVRTRVCRHCGSAHLPGMGAAPAWSA